MVAQVVLQLDDLLPCVVQFEAQAPRRLVLGGALTAATALAALAAMAAGV